MEFLKALFDKAENGTLTFEQLKAACEEAGIKPANLATGEYVSKSKYDSEITAKDTQISTLNTTIATRDKDLAELQTQLQNAGTDATKLSELTNQFDTLKTKYDTDTQNLQEKLNNQAYEFAVKEFANSKKFTSNAAKRDFINSMIAKGLKMESDKILGAEDFVTTYSADNADAFVIEKPDPEPPKPQPPIFVDPTPGPTPPPADGGFKFNFAGVRPRENK